MRGGYFCADKQSVAVSQDKEDAVMKSNLVVGKKSMARFSETKEMDALTKARRGREERAIAL